MKKRIFIEGKNPMGGHILDGKIVSYHYMVLKKDINYQLMI